MGEHEAVKPDRGGDMLDAAFAKHRAETEIEDGWCDVEEENERTAFRAGWLACVAAAREKMPGQKTIPWEEHDALRARGWNNCLSVMAERLDELVARENAR